MSSKVTKLQLRIQFKAFENTSSEYLELMQRLMEPDPFSEMVKAAAAVTYKQLQNARARLLQSIDQYMQMPDAKKRATLKAFFDKHCNNTTAWVDIEGKVNLYLQGYSEGARATNSKKAAKAADRQNKIQQYLINNKQPQTKGLSFENHLIKVLKLDVSPRTVSDDLKLLNIDKKSHLR